MNSAARMNKVEDEAEEVENSEDEDEDYWEAWMAMAGANLPYDPLIDIITEEDWKEVKRLTNFLVSFYKMIRRLKANMSDSGFGSLWQTITNIQNLHDLLRETVDETASEPDDSFSKTATRYDMEKLTTYWIKLIMEPNTSYNTIVTILHPDFRLAWFEDHWRDHAEWYKKAENSIKTVFRSYLEQETDDDDILNSPPTTRHKIPTSSIHEERFSRTMSVDLNMLTGDKAYKKAKIANDLDIYYAALREVLNKERALMEELLQ